MMVIMDIKVTLWYNLPIAERSPFARLLDTTVFLSREK